MLYPQKAAYLTALVSSALEQFAVFVLANFFTPFFNYATHVYPLICAELQVYTRYIGRLQVKTGKGLLGGI
jgi:hypothetical protein